MFDKHLCFMLVGGFFFGMVGILVLFLLIYLGVVDKSAPFVGGTVGIVFTAVGLIIGGKLSLR